MLYFLELKTGEVTKIGRTYKTSNQNVWEGQRVIQVKIYQNLWEGHWVIKVKI